VSEQADTQRPHHRHLEQARRQIIELLSRQAVERELINRTEAPRHDVVAQLVERQHQAALAQKLSGFHPADIAFVLEALEPGARDLAWSLVRAERRGAVLLETGDAVRRSLVLGMQPEAIAQLVTPLDPDDIADVIGELPDEIRQQVLEKLDNADQAEVRSVLSFPPDSVGAVMDLDYVAVREEWTLEQVLSHLRQRGQLPAQTSQLFVVDRRNVLKGLLHVSALVLNLPSTPVTRLMTGDPVYFFTDDRMREAAVAFEKYDLLSAPVINLHNQIVGRLTVDAVLDDINERAQSESLRQVGLSEEEDLFAPVMRSARNRWPWLGLNLLTAFISSRVIGAFEGVIAQLVALAALMPIVASIGGNTGNQTVALVIRGLALDQLGPAQLRQMLFKEIRIATVNALVWGSVLAVATVLIYRNLSLAAVIEAAVILNLWVAALGGVLVPLLLHRFGRDPVMGSSVLLTALTDSMGFLIFLGLAAAFLV